MSGTVNADWRQTRFFMTKHSKTQTAAHWLENLALRSILWAVRQLPPQKRPRVLGRIVRYGLGPLAGWRRRALSNLDLVWPDMPIAQKRQIADQSLRNIGYLFAEIYDPGILRKAAANAPMEGPGRDALLAALAGGQPVLLAGGHYGNYEAPKAALAELGYPVAMIYRAADNSYFQKHYWQTMRNISGPIFKKGKKGTAEFFEHVARGKPSAILIDVRVKKGEVIPFLGHPAATATTAAWLATKHKCLLVPFWGIRTDDQSGFRIYFDEPIQHGDPVEMTKDLNRSLEARIKEDPGQWLWSHRRWKL